MARRETAARRYAEAAFQIGRADGTLDDWERDFATISQLLANDEVRRILQHPVIPYAAKERVLQRAAAGIRPDVLNLVLLMIRRGRPRSITAMVDRFDDLLRRERGISKAEIRSALRLGDEEREAIVARLRELTGTKIETSEHVDKSLIGGVTVRIGDTLYDASVRSRLERLRARLTVA